MGVAIVGVVSGTVYVSVQYGGKVVSGEMSVSEVMDAITEDWSDRAEEIQDAVADVEAEIANHEINPGRALQDFRMEVKADVDLDDHYEKQRRQLELINVGGHDGEAD